MIKKGLQIIAMLVVGLIGLVGISWLVHVRAGFLPDRWNDVGFRWWHVSVAYRLLLGVDALLLAWAIGWIAVSALGRIMRHAGAAQGVVEPRPSRYALVVLFLLQAMLPIAHRPEGTPALLLGRFGISGLTSWRWAPCAIGGSVASLAFVLCCAGLALWHFSGAFQHSPRSQPTALPEDVDRRVARVARTCTELICGVALIVGPPLVLQAAVRAVWPSARIFQESVLGGVLDCLMRSNALVLPAGAASIAVLSWAVGAGFITVVRRARERRPVDLPGEDGAHLRVGKRITGWLLASLSLMTLVLAPDQLGRFSVRSQTTGWWFYADIWLALFGLVVVAAAVLFVVEATLAWWDSRGKSVATPSGPAVTE